MKRHPFEGRPKRSAGRHSKDTAESRIKLLKRFESESGWVGESESGRIGGFGSWRAFVFLRLLCQFVPRNDNWEKKAEFNDSAIPYIYDTEKLKEGVS